MAVCDIAVVGAAVVSDADGSLRYCCCLFAV